MPRSGSGVAARVAQLGHRGPEVGGGERADERALHDAVGVGDHRHRDRGDLVAAVEITARLGVDLAGRDRRRLEHARASPAGPRHESHAADENSATSHGASGRGKSARSSWRGTGYTSRGGASGGRRRRSHAIASTTTRIATAIARRPSSPLSRRTESGIAGRDRRRRRRPANVSADDDGTVARDHEH